MNETVDLPRSAELLLVRLLIPGKARPSPKKLREELSKLGAALASEPEWEAILAQLQAAGLVNEKPMGLTDAGHQRALGLLGLAELPPRITWPKLRDGHLLAVAAGLLPNAGESPAMLATKPRLAGHLLRREFGLTVAAGTALPAAAAALVCQELGFPGLSDYKALQAAVLARVLGMAGDSLPPTTAVEQFVRVKFQARGKVDELRRTAIVQWVRGASRGIGKTAQHPSERHMAPSTSSDSTAAGDDLASFAAAVAAAARDCQTGRFGDNKVFINHVWKTFQNSHGHRRLDLPAFKQRLIEANREGLVRLSRADLLAAMNADDVRESEIRYLNSDFHFVLTEGREP